MSHDPNGEFPKNIRRTVTVRTPPNVHAIPTPEAARAVYKALQMRCDELARALGNVLRAFDDTEDAEVHEMHVAEARKLYADYLAAGIRAK